MCIYSLNSCESLSHKIKVNNKFIDEAMLANLWSLRPEGSSRATVQSVQGGRGRGFLLLGLPAPLTRLPCSQVIFLKIQIDFKIRKIPVICKNL